ncbi:hypothetical protein FBU30_006481 [Linnemannia zychae]|nr:hypothetical protein FBU30_006481 [Linnemannia zychae]
MDKPIIDKKRARPKDDSTRARKKVASELMAFEFESLSLSGSNGGSTSRVEYLDGSDSLEFPQRHPSVQRQNHSLQDDPIQQDQDHIHSISLEDQYHQRAQLQSQSHPQRSRATSSPVVPGRPENGKAIEPRHAQLSQNIPGTSTSSASGTSSSSRTLIQHAGMHRYTEQHGSSSQTSYSPLSPPMSPPSQSATMDICMAIDEGAMNNSRPSTQQFSSMTSTTDSTQTKILNFRQRKWNSVSKVWQEWHDVQATHTPDLPSPPSQQAQDPAARYRHPANGIVSMESISDTEKNSFLQRQQHHNTPGPISSNGVSSSNNNSNNSNDGKNNDSSNNISINNNNSRLSSSNSSGDSGSSSTTSTSGTSSLGRQRSLHETRDRLSIGQTQDEFRMPIGSRARSFSETNIYPYTQHQDHQQHQQHQQLLLQQQQHQLEQQQLCSSSIPLTNIPSQHWSSSILDTATQQHQRSDIYPRKSIQEVNHLGHPPRHHSDHIHQHCGDSWVGHGPNDGSSSRHGVFPQNHSLRLRSSLSSSHGSARQSPWMDLTMTALDGTVNTSGDRFGSYSSGGGSSFVHVGSLSHSHQRAEEASPWNQHLPKSQNGYRENLGISRHGGFGRSSPVQYSHHHLHNQHSQEDVSMGEDTVRLLPSRSSSPSPCLSMAPTITRPLSISFSHLTGANMLADLAENECDEDMEL